MELFKIGFVAVRLVDILDISIVAFLFYKLYETLRHSLALRVIGLLLSFLLIWKLVDLLDFVLLKSILDQLFNLGAIALVILFSPEIRRFLLQISKNTLFDRLLRLTSPRAESESTYRAILDALRELKANKDGALIVLAGNDPLAEIVHSGDTLNADLSARLIVSIFHKFSPLHDGAVILAGNKIVAARCILPISESSRIPAELGMRHRAAIGVSEISDAWVIVLSEERGEISLASQGKLTRNVDFSEIETQILGQHSSSANAYTSTS